VSLQIRKVLTTVEETRIEGGAPDGEPLRKAVACAVIANPYAGHALAADLSDLVDGSAALGTLLGGLAADALGVPAESYGKAALVGTDGEQEHANACITTAFGEKLREAIGGGTAWLSSVTKRCAAGTAVDVPLAYRDEIWVRSHYDAITTSVPDAPLPGELVVICALASRARLHARLGGKTKEEADAEAGAG
jgi:hypothetical protein